MIILGVDPGTLVTGFGVIERRRNGFRVLACDVVRNTSDTAMPMRLKRIYDSLCLVIRKHKPDAFAIESAFYGKNVQSTLKIGYARGVSLLAAVNHQLPTSEYSPREVKRAVVGNGAASKHQVQFMVKSLLQLREIRQPYDVTDALAVALCHFNHLKLNPRARTGAKQTRPRTSSWIEFLSDHPERIVRIR